jgi:hypothetical protein
MRVSRQQLLVAGVVARYVARINMPAMLSSLQHCWPQTNRSQPFYLPSALHELAASHEYTVRRFVPCALFDVPILVPLFSCPCPSLLCIRLCELSAETLLKSYAMLCYAVLCHCRRPYEPRQHGYLPSLGRPARHCRGGRGNAA